MCRPVRSSVWATASSRPTASASSPVAPAGATPARSATSSSSSGPASSRSSAMPEQRAVDLVARHQVRDGVGDLHARRLGATGRRARSGRRGGRRSRAVTASSGSLRPDQQRAGGGVVEAEPLALERRPGGADGLGGGDVLERLDAERGRHQQLADVVQQAGEVRGVGVRPAQVGGGVGVGGDRDGVDVQLAAREVRAAGEALEEAVGRGLQRDPHERAAAEQRDGLADRARADRARVGRRVRVAQEVGGERLVGLDHRDEVARATRSGRRRACGCAPRCRRARAAARSAGGRRARAYRAWRNEASGYSSAPTGRA